MNCQRVIDVMTDRIHTLLRRHFSDAAELSSGDLLHSHGSASQALLYSVLYVPQFLELGDSIVLRLTVPTKEEEERFLALRGQVTSSASLEQLEASFNFLETGYIFDAQGRDSSDDEDDVLSHLLVRSWRGLLTTTYPNRRFVVEVVAPEQTGGVVGIQFYELRSLKQAVRMQAPDR